MSEGRCGYCSEKGYIYYEGNRLYKGKPRIPDKDLYIHSIELLMLVFHDKLTASPNEVEEDGTSEVEEDDNKELYSLNF
jgi:hypothetical protein